MIRLPARLWPWLWVPDEQGGWKRHSAVVLDAIPSIHWDMYEQEVPTFSIVPPIVDIPPAHRQSWWGRCWDAIVDFVLWD